MADINAFRAFQQVEQAVDQAVKGIGNAEGFGGSSGETMYVKMNPSTPTPLTAAALERQMEAIGLNCAEINEATLNQYLAEVEALVPNGAVASWGIGYTDDNANFQSISPGNWILDEGEVFFGVYQRALTAISHYYLWSVVYGDNIHGVLANPPAIAGNYKTADTIKSLFVNSAITASSTVVSGIKKDSILAAMANAIAPLTNDSLNDYHDNNHRTLMIIENYNPRDSSFDRFGALTIQWSLDIEDYKRKSKDGGDTHKTQLDTVAWAVTYDSYAACQKDYNNLARKLNLASLNFPPES